MNFGTGKLIPRKIVKTVAIVYHILKLKCTKFDFKRRYEGAYIAPQTPKLHLRGYLTTMSGI